MAKRRFIESRKEIIKLLRTFFEKKGFLEVETPIRVPSVAPENYIEPFESEDWFLITSPELQMKKLLSEGYDRIFQITKAFRKGERGRFHLPEFTILEWYRARASYEDLMKDCHELITFMGESLSMPDPFDYQGLKLSYAGDWRIFTVKEAFKRWAAWDPFEIDDSDGFSLDLVEKIEPALRGFTEPCILKDYPLSEGALAKRCDKGNNICERFEVYWAGIELANGCSEIVSLEEMEGRFDMVRKAKLMKRPSLGFIERMVPSAGIALGVDRLVMIFTGAFSIDQVVAFCPEEL